MQKPLIFDKSLSKVSKIEKLKIRKYVEDFEASQSIRAMGILNYEPVYISNNFIAYAAFVCEMVNTENAIACVGRITYLICDDQNNIIDGKYTGNKSSKQLYANIEEIQILDANNSAALKLSYEQQKELEFAKSAVNAKIKFNESCR